MALVETAPAVAQRQTTRSFFSPLVDFLCLGGGSLLLLPVLIFVIPNTADASALFLAMLLANVINYPHFAYSYQIFYRTFRSVMGDRSLDRKLRARYAFAGIWGPALLALFFIVALASDNIHILGYGGNAMMFFVGWHYVKQGYGMLMSDAAMKRCFFSEPDKKILLWNSYLCWITAWLTINRTVAERNLWGIGYSTFDFPVALLWVFAIGVIVTSLMSLLIMIQHSRAHGGRAPINGIAAYIAALYPWLFLGFEPVLGALIPCMHSLQYQLIVWRYQINVERGKADAGEVAPGAFMSKLNIRLSTLRFGGFLVRAMVLGVIGFWILPILFSQFVPYDTDKYGHQLFFFVFVIFINIHHYFIDNAMWRKENPHTLKYLFTPH